MPAYCRRPRSAAAPFRAANARQRPCSAAAPRPAFQLAPHRRLCIDGALALPRRPSRQSSVPMVPGQQQLRHNVPASSPLCRRFPCQQQLRQGCASHQAIRHGTPASNKPNSAEKSTAVWLAIWRIWAGFANSQLWRATFRSTYLYMCPSPLLPSWTAAQTDANLSAHLHRLPTTPPYLRKMRLSPSRGAGIRWVIRLSPGRMRRSCKSPRARIPVLGTSGAHWPARWPRFELTERVAKS